MIDMREPHTILIAEDDEFLAKMYQQKLLLEGYAVIVARDGEQALHALAVQKFSAVLLDIMMPKKNGFEVLTALRKSPDPAVAGLPVLIVSNLSHEEAIHQSLLTGANDYIVKPGSSPSAVTNILKKLVPSAHV